MKEAYLLHITLLHAVVKNLVEVRFMYLQMKSQKYVYACDSTDI